MAIRRSAVRAAGPAASTAIKKLRRGLTHPATQVAVAVAGMVGGAWLVGLWMVGVVVMVLSVAVLVDGVLRQPVDRPDAKLGAHESVLDRWKRAL